MCVCLCHPIVARQGLGKNPPIVVRQRLDKNSPLVARQRLARNVTAVTNTNATVEELLDALFLLWPLSYQGNFIPPSLLGNGSVKITLSLLGNGSVKFPVLFLGYGLGDRAIGVRFPVGARDIPVLHNVQTSSAAHSDSYTMGSVAVHPGRTAGA
jgi:hypothetical protein